MTSERPPLRQSLAARRASESTVGLEDVRPSSLRTIEVNPCPYEGLFDLHRWYWCAKVDGQIPTDAHGYTLTRWAAKSEARRWHRIDRRNRRRMDTPTSVLAYPSRKGSSCAHDSSYGNADGTRTCILAGCGVTFEKDS